MGNDSSDASRKRVLIMSYYFPPAGGAPVQRVLKFSKYLRDFGWEPVVLTVRNGAYSSLDPLLEDQIPSGVSVNRTDAWDPFALYARLKGKAREDVITVGMIGEEEIDWKERMARWIRANVFVPDARVGWVPYAVRAARRLIREQPVDALFTTGPPHSAHLIGQRLHRQTGLPWIADFRDPWTEIDYMEHLPQSAWTRSSNAFLERRVLQRADLVTTISPTLKAGFKRSVPEADIRVIYNGFDEADFDGLDPEPASAFRLLYAGSMNEARNVEGLWNTLGALRRAGDLEHLRLCFMGSMDVAVRRSLERHGLLSILEDKGQVSHREVLTDLLRGTVHLLVINRVDTSAQKGILPTKVFEYLGSGWPVLAVGPPEGDLRDVLHQTGGGALFDYKDQDGMKGFLLDQYDAWKAGTLRPQMLDEARLQFSRRVQTSQLADLLNQLTP